MKLSLNAKQFSGPVTSRRVMTWVEWTVMDMLCCWRPRVGRPRVSAVTVTTVDSAHAVRWIVIRPFRLPTLVTTHSWTKILLLSDCLGLACLMTHSWLAERSQELRKHVMAMYWYHSTTNMKTVNPFRPTWTFLIILSAHFSCYNCIWGPCQWRGQSFPNNLEAKLQHSVGIHEYK